VRRTLHALAALTPPPNRVGRSHYVDPLGRTWRSRVAVERTQAAALQSTLCHAVPARTAGRLSERSDDLAGTAVARDGQRTSTGCYSVQSTVSALVRFESAPHGPPTFRYQTW